jgi:hypothetical protein
MARPAMPSFSVFNYFENCTAYGGGGGIRLEMCVLFEASEFFKMSFSQINVQGVTLGVRVETRVNFCVRSSSSSALQPLVGFDFLFFM